MNRVKTAIFLLCVGLIFFTGACTRNPPPTAHSPRPTSHEAYVRLADKLAGQAQFKSSNYYLGRALDICQQAGAWVDMIDCHLKLGDNYQELGDHERAMIHLDRALNLAMQQSDVEYSELAMRFQKMAYKHFSNGDHKRALDMYQKALSLLLKVFPEHHRRVARIYNSVALIYWNMGDHKNATQYYNKSLSIKLRSFSRTRVDFTKKYTFINGELPDPSAYRDLKDYIRRSLKIHLETYGNVHPLIALLYDNIGVLYSLEGSYSQAMEYFRKSLMIRLELLGDESLECADSYKNLGICFRLQGDLLEASKFLESSLQIKKIFYPGYHPHLSDTYYQIGKVYFLQDNYNRALEYYQQSLMCLAPGFSNQDVRFNPEFGDLHFRNEILKILSDKAAALRMRYRVSDEGPEDLDTALKTYELISRLIGLIRREFKSDDYKLIFGERSHHVYTEAIHTALDLFEITGEESYKNTAFFFSEKSKAALLFEAVVESRAKRFSGISSPLLEREGKIRDEIAHYGTYLEREYQGALGNEKSTIAELEEEYYAKQREYQGLIEYLEGNYPKYYNLKYRPQSVGVKALQQSLAGKVGMVEYFVGEERVSIFVITPTRFFVSTQSVGPSFPA